MLSPLFYQPLPAGLDKLAELALDLRWTWTHEGDQFWNTVNPVVWSQTQNPWLILQSTSRSALEKLARKPEFIKDLQHLTEVRQQYLDRTGWFQRKYPENTVKPVAYFSMEFGLGEALPLYAGGLGILAGDYLKTASDLNVPLVGIGLLYQEGYFRQILDSNGWQTEAYPYNDPTSLPIRPVIDESGGWLRVPLELPGRTLWLRVWQAHVGRVMLYLLDSNEPLNSPADRGITNKLYDDRLNIRLMQEMVLGIGGWRVIRALNIPVEICHLNEGHPAFVILERARDFMNEKREPFHVALCVMRAGTVFTTHTPVDAGFDRFPAELIARYFGAYLETANIPLEQLLELGRTGSNNKHEPFNMAYLATRGSISINGVSWLHGRVSRRIFSPLYPRWPQVEVPVTHVTNGVHVPSWDSALADQLWTETCGKERWLHTLENLSDNIDKLNDEELWALRTRECQSLIAYVRQKLANQLRQQGADAHRIREAQLVLDSNVLTIGFARRFAAYKRPDLLLTDPERLISIITSSKYPAQLVVAGKAHPEDEEGERLVQQFVSFANRPSIRRKVVFLEDYDIAMAQQLVKGVDLWINTPRRPWEACGTSGMKVLVNGGLNVSELDGWWAEAYSPEVGWALGDGKEHAEPEWDLVEANQLYDLLEKEIIPLFYTRNAQGIAVEWVKKMRASMSRLAPRFSSNQMLREYVQKIYIPTSERLHERMAEGARLAQEIYAWHNVLEQHWPDLHFGDLKVEQKDDKWHFEVPVYFGELDPDFVTVELYAAPFEEEYTDPYAAVRVPMERGEKILAINSFIYRAAAPAVRPAEHFTIRAIPAHPSACVPLEDNHIMWQK
ncbi:MAG: alpha-glucan family phosphorylase [Chloroflexi bacterium]|nr:alpha-glucan family phosphorylase [Chloroflexota bacterium]